MVKWNGDQSLEVLTLNLEGEMFAIEARHVREILDIVPITDVPRAPPFINGLINVRGKVVPLADLRVRFGMAQKPPTIDTRIVVLELDLDGEPVIVGIRADKVHEVVEVAAAALQEAPTVGMRWRPEFIRCIGKRGDDFMIVMDIARVFTASADLDTPRQDSDDPSSAEMPQSLRTLSDDVQSSINLMPALA
jgi:purine-binding chemotaxis protein CheW